MKWLSVLAGGLVSGLIIVLGEAVLNLAVLAEDWVGVFSQFDLPQPTALVAVQGLIKLLMLGVFSVWLATILRNALPAPDRAGIVSGLIVWFLVWAWVQWGMLLAGYVTASIAVNTVAWGFVELPLAAWAGAWVQSRTMARMMQGAPGRP